MVLVVAFAVAASLALGLPGCLGDEERDAYVAANEGVFAELPRFPGATVVAKASTAYRASESGPVVGYGTRFDLELPPSANADVAAFYRDALEPEWRLVEQLDGPVLNFRRGRSSVSINLESWRARRLEVGVDHAYYGKLGR